MVSEVLKPQVWKMAVARVNMRKRYHRQGQAGAEGGKGQTEGGEDTRPWGGPDRSRLVKSRECRG